MKLKDLSLIAMMTALTAVMGAIPPIPIPISPIPITLQSIAPMLAGTILGARRGALSMMLLILLGACSLPVFSGGRGGVGVLLGPSGGFIFGWVLVAFFIGLYVSKKKNLVSWKLMTMNCLIGIVLLYVCGATYMALTTAFSFQDAMMLNVFFIPGDLIKAIIAALVGIRVVRALNGSIT
ncbi:biotin transport system substrate-specific component [Alkalihalobacillus xiaoxiensis]|uniref:Biotin transporter n=1 Tax=Shouchella xiaoxiensis TaxID=766895 RepID=A0ABS2SVT6_9BACI|nr:biotin transporter BioY [Shouchella xiaoxiensis]MBM7838584.1 biotin transport system substrate-specific component [Shouchella xiaoxiensis]